jgi:Lrp/AsnC family transcriptional regulator, leucine-responsive regulatory protein
MINSGTNLVLDQISRALLVELQKDARIPFAELGRRVGLSPSATAERVRRLEDDGVIRGYRADIDPAAIGLRIMVYIRMTCDGDRYKQFLPFVKTLDAVRECYHVTGSDALVMKVLVGSTDELEDLILRFLPFGSPTTSFVLSKPLVRIEYSLETPKQTRKLSSMLIK